MPHSDTLMFPSITQSDAGAYQCVANNGFGHPATDTITVLVKRKLFLKTLSSNFLLLNKRITSLVTRFILILILQYIASMVCRNI